MSKINTNMASEFWFYSQLHRLGYQAYITLANTKAIDIVVHLNDNDQTLLTFDVKGKESFQNGTYPRLRKPPYKENHFLVFIGLQTQKERNSKRVIINDPPICYIINANKLNRIAFEWRPLNGRSEGGYGFNQRILPYLKSSGKERIIQRSLDEFKQRHNINGEIDFEFYQEIIMDIQDFEEKFHEHK